MAFSKDQIAILQKATEKLQTRLDAVKEAAAKLGSGPSPADDAAMEAALSIQLHELAQLAQRVHVSVDMSIGAARVLQSIDASTGR